MTGNKMQKKTRSRLAAMNLHMMVRSSVAIISHPHGLIDVLWSYVCHTTPKLSLLARDNWSSLPSSSACPAAHRFCPERSGLILRYQSH
jgi:hypothetical protein